MNNNGQNERNTRALGLLLLAVGAWILIARFIHINLGDWLWPFWIIVPGGLIIALGFHESRRKGEGLVTFGSIVAVTGIILFIQNITGQWQSWAYAWALLFPGSIGLGKYLWGKQTGNAAAVHAAEKTIRVAVMLFIGFGIFFEVVLGIGGFHLGSAGRIIVPVLLIAAGVAIYLTSGTDGHIGIFQPPAPPQAMSAPPQPPVKQEGPEDDITRR
ncbi:MAG TPA: hypothetical protein VN478_00585 [Clostridia bacterium]|nr:hypothetical protein [Clostridia bacterium]